MVADLLRNERRVVILVGSEYLQYGNAITILDTLRKLSLQLKADVMPLPAQANLMGSIQMGCYPELLPGGTPVEDTTQKAAMELFWGAKISSSSKWNSINGKKKVKVLYVIGEVPPLDVNEIRRIQSGGVYYLPEHLRNQWTA